ncbi:MAG: TIM barrel protein [archaeon]
MGDKSYESFYNGGLSTFEPEYGFSKDASGTFIGKHAFASNLGFPGSTQTANQLKESVNAIKQGVKAFEVTMGVADTAEQIPKQHFEEMRALMKLTGVTPSVHAPFTIDPAGFEQQKGYSEENRIDAERRLFGTLEKAKQLSNEKGVTVVFHSSGGVPGTEYRPGVGDEERFHTKKIFLMDQETGQVVADPKEERDFSIQNTPQEFKDGGRLQKPLERVGAINESKWREKMTNLANLKKMTNEVLGNTNMMLLAPYKDINLHDEKAKEIMASLPEPVQQTYHKLQEADIFIHNTHLNFDSAFHTAYKYGNEDQQGKLKQLAANFQEEMKGSGGTLDAVERHRTALSNAIQGLQGITHATIDPKTGEVVSGTPQLITPVEDFARGRASETFGNLAWRSYNELAKRDADKTPVIAVENMFTGMAFPRAEDLKKLVIESRDKFVKNAVQNGVDKQDAKEAAEKVIGVTWDVGHLNLLKKEGFTDEDIRKQSEIIAPYVKHVHLTDNFGYADSHLAPGMGNVPIKKILEELEKKGDLAAMGKIVEAPGFVQHFQKSPHGWTMAALGSPIYGAMMGPYWNQVTGMAQSGGYFGGPQAFLPERHFSMYGSGFAGLPTELGGQMPGNASRSTGTPMA